MLGHKDTGRCAVYFTCKSLTGGKAAGEWSWPLTHPSSAEVKNAWSSTFTSPIRIHGVVLSYKKHRDNFTFTKFVGRTWWWWLWWSFTYLLHGAGHYLKKLIVTQLVKKYLAFLWNLKVHYRVHKSPPLDPILSQLNPVCPVDSYLPKVHLIVILPPTPRSSQWSLTFRPPNQNPVNTSPLPPCVPHVPPTSSSLM
jgi:hypothetical protein